MPYTCLHLLPVPNMARSSAAAVVTATATPSAAAAVRCMSDIRMGGQKGPDPAHPGNKPPDVRAQQEGSDAPTVDEVQNSARGERAGCGHGMCAGCADEGQLDALLALLLHPLQVLKLFHTTIWYFMHFWAQNVHAH